MVKLNDFNADNVEPAGSFDPLPAGEYVVVIESSDEKDNKKGTGQYLKMVYNVVEGDYEGRKIFENLNIVNDSADAQKIGMGKLRDICIAVGNHTPDDTEELHNIPFIAKVAIKKGNDDYPEPQNIVRKYRAINPDEDDGSASQEEGGGK